jgi:hypothetical protein
MRFKHLPPRRKAVGLNRPSITALASKFIAFRASGAHHPITTAAPAAQPQETTMAKAKKKIDPLAPTRFKAPSKTKNIGTKRAVAAKAVVNEKKKLTRKDEVAAMLKRAKGATVEQVCEKTSMLPHSARALISQIAKVETVSTSKEGKNATVYFIKAAA